MKKISSLILLTAVVVLSACNNKKNQNPSNPDQETVSIDHAMGTVEVPVDPQRVVVLNFGTLENLDLIGANVVGIPKMALPKYLSKYDTDSITDVGTLAEVNLEAINELQPDLIISGSRLADSYDALSRIAPTIVARFDTEDQLGALQKDLDDLGKIFGHQEEFDKEMAAIMEKVEETKAKTDTSSAKALVVLHNKGRFSAYGSGSRFGLVHDVLGVEEAAEGLETHTHGNRASSEFIQQTNPDILFVVDRSAAIGDQPLNKSEVENELIQRTKAYQNGRVVYLNPEAWYLSGTGGITSMNIMIDEVAGVFESMSNNQ